jgi:hypothetical protein
MIILGWCSKEEVILRHDGLIHGEMRSRIEEAIGEAMSRDVEPGADEDEEEDGKLSKSGDESETESERERDRGRRASEGTKMDPRQALRIASRWGMINGRNSKEAKKSHRNGG